MDLEGFAFEPFIYLLGSITNKYVQIINQWRTMTIRLL